MKIVRLFGGTAVLAAFALTASAAVITTPLATLNGNTPVVTQFNTGTYTLDLDQFDPSLGTLTDITLHFASTSTYALTMKANGSNVILQGAPANQMKIGVQMQVYGPNFGFAGFPLYTPSTGNTVANQIIPNGNSIAINSPLGGTSDSLALVIDSTSYADYTGLGTVSMDVAGQNFIANIQQILGTYQLTGTGTVVGSVYADYTYTPAVVPTPEPGTMGLIGGGLIGAAMITRKRRALR